MTCEQICSIINNAVCMNLCAMGLAPSGYSLVSSGNYWLLIHSELKQPLAKLHQSENLAIEQLREHLLKLDRVTKSK